MTKWRTEAIKERMCYMYEMRWRRKAMKKWANVNRDRYEYHKRRVEFIYKEIQASYYYWN